MASKTQALAALLILVAMALAAAMEGAHAVCNMSNADFMECQPAAAKTTNPTPSPTDKCCAALGKADLPCLCAYKNSGWLAVYNIDPSRAAQLPAKCGLTIPTNC